MQKQGANFNALANFEMDNPVSVFLNLLCYSERKERFLCSFCGSGGVRVTADEPQDTGALPPEASASRADAIQP